MKEGPLYNNGAGDSLKSLKHIADGTYIQTVLNRIQMSNEPLLISMWFGHGTGGEWAGHAIVTRTDKKIEKMTDEVGDEWYRVYVYDPNTPYFSESYSDQSRVPLRRYYLNYVSDDRYIELNPKKNLWRYKGDINGGGNDAYWGCDESGNVKYMIGDYFGKGEFLPEYMFVSSMNHSYLPLEFNGTESWLSRWADKIEINLQKGINLSINTTSGVTLCDVVDGVPFIYSDALTYNASIGIMEDGTAVNSGKLAIPYSDFVIDYKSGDDISIIGIDSVVNIASTNNVAIDISINDGIVTVTGNENSEIIMQLSDVYSNSEYTSIVADGTLNTSDTVTLQLKKDNFNAKFTGTGSLELTTDNETDPESRIIGTLNKDNTTVDIDDVREVPSDIPDEPEKATVTRISGTNRIKTAIASADKLKEVLGVDKFQTIVVANAMNFPDALSGSYLAAATKAPILLYADGQALVTNYIRDNLTEGGKVYILGGTGSVSESIVSILEGIDCQRVSGSGRYGTSLEIIKTADEILGTKPNKILICDGTGFADSLSASATGLPILLVNGKGDTLRDDQKAYLESVRGAELYVIGGTGTIIPAMMDALKPYDADVERIYGSGRELTSVAVAEKFFSEAKVAALADSRDFPDGLSGGPVAYAMNMPLLLTRESKESVAASYITERSILEGYVIGGTDAVADVTARAVFGESAVIK